MRQVMHRLIAAWVALLACGCAHVPWADDPSAEPPKVCAASQPRSGKAKLESEIARGQSFYCGGLYAPAAGVFSELAAEKEAERGNALRWLVYIHRRFPFWEQIGDTVGQMEPSDLDSPEIADVRDDLHVLAARFEYRHERFDEALALLRTIPASSRLRARAALFEGAIHVRTGAPDRALTAFTEALRAAPTDRDPQPTRDLAVISLARFHHAMEQLDAASRYYESIPASSSYAMAAALEGGTTRFEMKDLPRALALLKSLDARSGEIPSETMIRALLLRATIAAKSRPKEETLELTRQIHLLFLPFYFRVRRLAGAEPDALFELGFSVRAGGSLAPPLGTEHARLLLADPLVARRFDEYDELSRELAVLERDRWPYAALHSEHVELIERHEAVAREAGELLQRRLQLLADQLPMQIKEAVGIEYFEIHSGSELEKGPWRD